MEALPIFLDRLVTPYMAIILSVSMVLIFGEILPQAIFAHYRLPIGAYLSGFVWVLEFVLCPVAWPIAKLLDYFLGDDHPTIYRRAELKELTKRHIMTTDGQGTLSQDEVQIMSGVLDMATKQAKDAMHAIDSFFMLDCDVVLDEECMQAIMASGHSRIPVYLGNRQNIVGLLIVKNIILVDPASKTRLRDVSAFAVRRIERVSAQLPLFELLHYFGQGRSHLALVCGEPEHVGMPLASCPVVGVISMEDVIEELIQEEILDEADLSADVCANLASKFMTTSRQDLLRAPRPAGEEEAGADMRKGGGGGRGRRASIDELAAAGGWRTIALTNLLQERKAAVEAGSAGERGAGAHDGAAAIATPLGLTASAVAAARASQERESGRQGGGRHGSRADRSDMAAPLLDDAGEAGL
jgi:hypothetical protein